jgi:hypothetical protein
VRAASGTGPSGRTEGRARWQSQRKEVEMEVGERVCEETAALASRESGVELRNLPISAGARQPAGASERRSIIVIAGWPHDTSSLRVENSTYTYLLRARAGPRDGHRQGGPRQVGRLGRAHVHRSSGHESSRTAVRARLMWRARAFVASLRRVQAAVPTSPSVSPRARSSPRFGAIGYYGLPLSSRRDSPEPGPAKRRHV